MIQYVGDLSSDLYLNNALTQQEQDEFNIQVYQSIDSTNTKVRSSWNEDLLAQQPQGLIQLICADEQTAGKGRMQRHWYSPAGANIYSSFAFHLPSSLDLSGLSLAIGLGLRRVLAQHSNLDIKIKWPNDLVTAQGKLSGILIEAFRLGNAWLVIAGIGINVNMQKTDEDHAQQSWTSITHETGHKVNRGQILAQLYRTFDCDITRFCQDGWSSFIEEWRQYDYLSGQCVNIYEGGVADPRRVWQAKAQGVDYKGQLLVEDAQAQIHSIISGDVSVRLS